ncbi:teichoic acid/polysaccharide phosphoglycerol transferase [Lacticaseibacillus paracasei subsp. paracasei Lpp123]|uniref:Teichoic acid/polysaccharide phosphoglycerol transferase n=1 Tax=Lacticaseibacillus paracasei subsp. paracasei Lpp123 TaxID=1256201 RepID=A0A829G6P9_LACPA|nr:teichoic acid/polysaccharide phosphoglycerol transferase [Lacticaseibacillus paracasei subsp. paracasei Lpp123]
MCLDDKTGKETEKAIKTYDDIEYYLKSNYLMNQKDLK